VSDPKSILLEGITLLDPVLSVHGFEFRLEKSGNSSGGPFAYGSYVRGDRRLELHLRYSLGLVTYFIGPDSLGHEDYMRLVGVWGQNSYPDTPKTSLDSFLSLAKDLEAFGSDFLNGSGEQFRGLAAKFKKNPNMFKGLPA
jgi:hypothetical protein